MTTSPTTPQATALPGATYHLGDLEVTRLGYGAMQLPGTGVMGPPRDHDEALAVLREVVSLGITHIDTADFYGPHVSNQLIREALAPYPEGLHLVTKVGARRDADGGWPVASSPSELREDVHANLERLGLDRLDVVNFRAQGTGDHGSLPSGVSVAQQVEVLAELQQEGLIRHLGLSTVDADQLAEAQTVAPIVSVQNFYNLAHRDDDDLVAATAEQGIAFVPYFPLGGFSPLQSQTLQTVADRLSETPMSVALAWLLQRSPNILLIPGTSSLAHLRANVAGAGLQLGDEVVAELDGIAG